MSSCEALVDITWQDAKGQSALMLAAQDDRIRLVERILNMAAETGRMEQVLSMRNADGFTAIELALRQGSRRSAALLAEAGTKERRRRKARLRRLSTSATVRMLNFYVPDQFPNPSKKQTAQPEDVNVDMQGTNDEQQQQKHHHHHHHHHQQKEQKEQQMEQKEDKEEEITHEESQDNEEVEVEGRTRVIRQRTISNNSLLTTAGSVDDQQLPRTYNKAKPVPTFSDKLFGLFTGRRGRGSLPPLAKKEAQQTPPPPPEQEDEDRIATLGPDGLYPEEEAAMSSPGVSGLLPKVLQRGRRAFSESRRGRFSSSNQ